MNGRGVSRRAVNRLPEPSEDEEDMLDLAYDRRENSRLGCQLELRPDLEGLTVSLPTAANNLFDHIPFDGTVTGRSSSQPEE